MADGVEITQVARDRQRSIIVNNFKCLGMKQPHATDEEVYAVWEANDITDFMENLIEVRAADECYMNMINGILNQKTFMGEFK